MKTPAGQPASSSGFYSSSDTSDGSDDHKIVTLRTTTIQHSPAVS